MFDKTLTESAAPLLNVKYIACPGLHVLYVLQMYYMFKIT